jgi:glycosyltransferase involved in cell wall biosynthesis
VPGEASSETPSYLERPDRDRILYVVQQHDYSGAEVMHLPLMQADADPLLACPPGSRTEQLARALGIPTVPLPFRPLRHSGGAIETARSLLRGLASAHDLRRVLRARPERRIIYCISLRPGMLATLAKTALRRRAVWFVSDFAPPPPVGAITRLLARIGCDRAIATSKAVGKSLTRRSRLLDRRTTVIYPGTDPARFDPGLARPGAPRAAVVGHVSPTKRTDLALEVALRVAERAPQFELEIVGAAQYREEDFAFERWLRQRIAADSALARHVRLAGRVDDVPAELARFGLLLHCRADEPFGVALIEAMAAGLPVVAPNAAGPAEIVRHEATGLLFEPDDADDAAAQVLRLIGDPRLAGRLGTAARAEVERRFSSAGQVEQMEGLLERLDSRAGP